MFQKDSELTDFRRMVHRLVREHGSPASPADIADAFGYTERTPLGDAYTPRVAHRRANVNRVMIRMVNDGQLYRVAPGQYVSMKEKPDYASSPRHRTLKERILEVFKECGGTVRVDDLFRRFPESKPSTIRQHLHYLSKYGYAARVAKYTWRWSNVIDLDSYRDLR